MVLEPWPDLTDCLNQKYQILGTFDLAHYDANMPGLYADLSGYRSREFLPNERIVFYFFEPDFYLNNTGFTVYNLQVILNALDISQSACIMLTLSYGVEKEIHQLGQDICNDHYPMKVVTNSYVQLVANPTPRLDIKNNFDQINMPFLCLNGIERNHRVMFLCLLEELGVLDQGIVTWNFGVFKKEMLKTQKQVVDHPHNLTLLTTVPFMPVNDRIIWNHNLKQIYNRHYVKFSNQIQTHPDVSWFGDFPDQGRDWCNAIEPGFAKAFLYVATETVFDYPHQLVTEKIFKSFINRRPFVVVGPAGMLQQLHRMGFKTFDQIIDESYDLIDDPSERIARVADIVADIAKKSVSELQELAVQVEDIINHNYDYYCNHFCKANLAQLLKTL
jgi:hypothetical protein